MAKHKKHKPKSRTAGVSTLRTVALAAAGIVVGVVGVLLARRKPSEGHAAPDLALGKDRPGPADRAPPAFRPDPTAPVTAAERESLRPATGPAPSIVEPRGSMASQTGA
ncbi:MULTISPECIES: hypothetical protein [unclassified Sphingomonas]|uniref:hypothetical protein n=1 Tax=unclassified Sphingomonas TaxID=196159 RepID=UPI00070210E7|nr:MULTISPECIES: hypothetical protein [unclassified Sphingomonas]KQM28934.1 hypothetical protein ASE58_03540 [Sphingomonas sp. Leaf9]KQM45635.1 hypothetical protein ASE57_03530 [Sphingomonas sp. Leaf11]